LLFFDTFESTLLIHREINLSSTPKSGLSLLSLIYPIFATHKKKFFVDFFFNLHHFEIKEANIRTW